MALKINEKIDSIESISVAEHNTTRINSVSLRYKEERQESKAPTFALT